MNKCYRQGVVITTTHPLYKKGQIVNILKEEDFYYTVQVGNTGLIEKVEKKDISFD